MNCVQVQKLLRHSSFENVMQRSPARCSAPGFVSTNIRSVLVNIAGAVRDSSYSALRHLAIPLPPSQEVKLVQIKCNQFVLPEKREEGFLVSRLPATPDFLHSS